MREYSLGLGPWYCGAWQIAEYPLDATVWAGNVDNLATHVFSFESLQEVLLVLNSRMAEVYHSVRVRAFVVAFHPTCLANHKLANGTIDSQERGVLCTCDLPRREI